MDPEHLEYFKDLIEGRNVPSWHPWWRMHGATLQATLSRTDFLRLKFGKVNAAATVLQDNGVSFEWSAKGRREGGYANLHPSAVDDDGHPLASVRAEAYDGALAAFDQGETEEGHRRLGTFVRRLRRLRDAVERRDGLADMEFDGEQLWEMGDQEAAKAILRAVARWKTDSDLEIPFVTSAQKKLDEIRGEVGAGIGSVGEIQPPEVSRDER